MILEFGYGKGTQTVDVPDKNLKAVLLSNEVKHERFGEAAVEYALANPIGSEKLSVLARDKKNVVIITSDISRPLPSYKVLPAVIKELNAAGVENKNIKVVFALGSHRKHTEEEKIRLAGKQVYDAVSCIDSDPQNTVNMGYTDNGTPVDIDKTVAEADFRIALGNIEFHYFAGYSGGAKALMPGVSTPNAIEHNHKLMVSPDACAGKLCGNPVRADIEQAEKLCHIDFIVNAVLSEHKEIVYAVAGDVTKAHRVGCEYLDKMYRKKIDARADIVIVSQGGAPKDANLYQTQKALDNSKHAVKKGGTVILVGACNEGFGNGLFEQWLKDAESPQKLVERIGKEFKLGGHKAAAVGQVLCNADIMLVSEFDDQTVKDIMMTPVKSLQEAFTLAIEKYGEDASVIAMPFGGATLPSAE